MASIVIVIVIHISIRMRLCSFHMFHVGNKKKNRDLEATFWK